MRRRQLLTTSLGAVGMTTVVGLAGCMGQGSDSGDGGGDGDGEIDYPTRDVEFIIPNSPGGGTDWWPRHISQYLGDYLPNSATFVHRNQPAAAGIIAANEVWNADPDGHTLMIMNLDSAANLQLTRDEPEYDVREFTQLGSPTQPFRSLFGRDEVFEEHDNWDSLVGAIQAGELSFATQGVGSSGQMIPALYGRLGGLWEPEDLNYVHHDGGTGEAVPTLERGDADIMFTTFTSALPYVGEDSPLTLAFAIIEEHDDFVSHREFGVPDDTAADMETLTTNNRLMWAPPDMESDLEGFLQDVLIETLQDEELIQGAEETGRFVNAIHGTEISSLVGSYIDLASEYQIPLLEELQG